MLCRIEMDDELMSEAERVRRGAAIALRVVKLCDVKEAIRAQLQKEQRMPRISDWRRGDERNLIPARLRAVRIVEGAQVRIITEETPVSYELVT